MKTFALVCSLALLQQAYAQCLPATAYCLSPPAVEVLLPSALPPTLPAACALQPGLSELLPALAPILASTISSSLAATLPPLLQAALPTVLTSALAAAAPLLSALPPSALPSTCASAPIVYASPAPVPTCMSMGGCDHLPPGGPLNNTDAALLQDESLTVPDLSSIQDLEKTAEISTLS